MKQRAGQRSATKEETDSGQTKMLRDIVTCLWKASLTTWGIKKEERWGIEEIVNSSFNYKARHDATVFLAITFKLRSQQRNTTSDTRICNGLPQHINSYSNYQPSGSVDSFLSRNPLPPPSADVPVVLSLLSSDSCRCSFFTKPSVKLPTSHDASDEKWTPI